MKSEEKIIEELNKEFLKHESITHLPCVWLEQFILEALQSKDTILKEKIAGFVERENEYIKQAEEERFTDVEASVNKHKWHRARKSAFTDCLALLKE